MTAVEHKVDRSGWPAGPWDTEGDRIEWRNEMTGSPCLMVRNGMGAWCGYVAVDKVHPLHGVGYDDVSYEIPSHCGLTYASPCNDSAICHVPQPGEPDDVWWLGFDCAHCDDVIPGMVKYFDGSLRSHVAKYRDEAYVRRTVDLMAVWLHEHRNDRASLFNGEGK